MFLNWIKKIETSVPAGRRAHERIYINSDRYDIQANAENTKQSAVICLLFVKDNKLQFVLIERESKGIHGGQIGFPGGKVEMSDKDLWHTSLRECEEEIGLLQNEILFLNKLTPVYIPISKFWVHPFVGYYQGNNFNPVKCDSEVKELIYWGVNDFSVCKIFDLKIEKENNEIWDVKGFQYLDYKIWGATAMILSEFQLMLSEKF